ncbi:MAG: adenylate/guanylate cyclase domain-containing protein [Acidimicrobiia bacterium]|nr:adenylate/guanylate cyclase domain-containing protein [Acidimicrobiia bacterium]MDH5237558.1 adenylate/guanylate cyclase domain-containing protein [Acidimicrobiia bacterium]
MSGVIAFTDIVGFTEFTASEGDARAVELLSVQRGIVDQVMPARGRVVKELGDGLLLWLDVAPEAVEAARRLQAAFQDRSANGDLPLWVRMGMHWGSPLERGDDLVGNDVNIAARISDQAGPGEIVVSEALVSHLDLTDSDVDLDAIGPVLMKGLPEAIWLYRIT